MAFPDILNLTESRVPTTQRGLSVVLMGDKKVGKTSLACSLDRSRTLLLAGEQGFRALNGVRAVSIPDFNTFRSVVDQLVKDAKNVCNGKAGRNDTMYTYIVLDTVDIIYQGAIDMVLSMQNVDDLSKTEAKNGYKKAMLMFEKEILKLLRATLPDGSAAYSVIAITHVEQKEVKLSTGQKTQKIVATCDKRANAVIQRHFDISCLLTNELDEHGIPRRYVVFRTPDGSAEVGGRFEYLPNRILLSPENFKMALDEAIKKQNEKDGIFDEVINVPLVNEEIEYDFDALMMEAKNIFEMYNQAGRPQTFASIVERTLGTGVRISDLKENQAKALFATIVDLKEKATELGLI